MKKYPLILSPLWWALPGWVSAGLEDHHLSAADRSIPSLERTSAEMDLQGRITSSTDLTKEHSLVSWIKSLEGGHVSDKLMVQSSTSIIATRDISQNETLMIIPPAAIVDLAAFEEDFEDIDIAGELFSAEDQSACHTVTSLIDQYTLVKEGMEDESPMGPYVQFLYEQVPLEKLPYYWSEEGKILMQTIVGIEMMPHKFGNKTFEEKCDLYIASHENKEGIHKMSQPLERMFALIRSRTIERFLVPLVDMIQHGQGAKQNVQHTTQADRSVLVTAIRDISAGDVLMASKLACMDDECMSIPELLGTHGILDRDYPHRWKFDTGYTDSFLSFEVASSSTEDSTQERVEFSPYVPNFNTQNWMQGHLRRLKNLSTTVSVALHAVESKHEREILQDFYSMMLHDLEMAYVASRESPTMDYSMESSIDIHSNQSHYYDALGTQPDKLQYEFDIPLQCEVPYSNVIHADVRHSFYQKIEFHHHYYEEIGKRDTCLFLEGYPQSCTNYRAHYHEIFVHYAASFLDNVERVLFVGGGDLMILHEILKYKDLEIVFGLELDQGVARESFRNFGIQPEFDNPKVRWIFGDATTSLQLIPQEYIGTFDLVLIDLQTYVADTVKVSPDMSIMDFGMHLLKPEGVLSQNHCHAPTRESAFANYAIDLVFEDIPGHCMEYLTVASNGINFLEKKTKDHGIFPLIFYEPANRKYYSAWNHFHNNGNANVEQKQRDFNVKDKGILTIVEAEMVKLPTFPVIVANLKQALLDSGLQLLEIEAQVQDEQASDEGVLFSVLLKEGFVIVRTWPDLQYCGIDLLMWSYYDKRYEAISDLVKGLGGSMDNTTSSFEMITGGMSFSEASSAKTEHKVLNEVLSHNDGLEIQTDILEVTNFVQEFDTLAKGVNSRWIVICGGPRDSCQTYGSLRDQSTQHILSLEPCSELLSSKEAMVSCEQEVAGTLRANVKKYGKFDGVIIDPDAPPVMGQIFHKISNSTWHRQEIYSESLVILAPTSDPPKHSWRDNLLERFRTEMISFNPVYHVHSTIKSPESSTWYMEIFSYGDSMFYSRLVGLADKLSKSSNLRLEIASGRAGAFSYPPDPTYPSMATNEDYDVSGSKKHFAGQETVGFQEIIQLQLPPKRDILLPGDKVLVNTNVHFWVGHWFDGEIVRQESEDEYLVKLENGEDRIVERNHLIKKDVQSSTNKLAVGERVLMHFSNFTKTVANNHLTHIEETTEKYGGIWRQGYIMRMHPNETAYDVRIMDLQFNEEYVVDRKDLIPQSESFVPFNDDDALSSKTIFGIINETVQELELPDPMYSTFQVPGAGQVFYASTEDCEIFTFWDGKSHVDLNVFSYLSEVEDVGRELLETFENKTKLEAIAFDRFPRGIGRVVTDPTDPFWFGQFSGEPSSSNSEAKNVDFDTSDSTDTSKDDPL